MQSKELLTWGSYFELLYNVCELITKELDDENIFLGLGRGGLIPLGIISHKLKTNRVYHIGLKNTRWNDDIQENKIIEYSGIECFGSIIGGRKLFIIDDLIDSGESIKYIYDKYSVYSKEVVVCCLIDKVYNNNLRHRMKVLTARNLRDERWIIFPYEMGIDVKI